MTINKGETMKPTARTRRSPDNGYASTRAVAQNGGKLPIYICNACNKDVVWCESKRTGKKYLVTVRRGHLDQRFYIGSQIHECPMEGDKAVKNAEIVELKRAIKTLNADEDYSDAGLLANVNAMRPLIARLTELVGHKNWTLNEYLND